MKFKETIKLLMDTDKFKEVKGNTIHYKDGIVELDLLVHMSEAVWQPEAVDVSEKETGCRLFTMSKKVNDIKPADVIKETSEFIKTKGKKVFMSRIQEQLNKHPDLYVDKNN